MLTNQAAKIITVHSFRRGTGKTTVAAGVATLLAAAGHQVGVIEVGSQLASLHYAFGLGTHPFEYTVQDYLHNRATITQIVRKIKPYLKVFVSGSIYLAVNRVDSTTLKTADTSIKTQSELDIESTLEDGDVVATTEHIGRLGTGLYDFIDIHHLDYLILDTNAGLNDEAILALNLADIALILLRPDQQDYQGTATAIQLYQQLDELQTLLVLNAVPASFNLTKAERQLADSYQASVGAVLPHISALIASEDVASFVVQHPNNTFTTQLQHLIHLIDTP